MSRILVFVLAIASAGLGFGQAVPPDTLITLQRGACEDQCAVYRLMIFADGTVIYQGRYYVKKTGLVKSGVSPEVLNKLLQDLDAGHFFDLAHKYGFGDSSGCKRMTAGEPTAILSVSSGGQSKTVLHEHGCQSAASDQVTALEDLVDKAVGTVRWIK